MNQGFQSIIEDYLEDRRLKKPFSADIYESRFKSLGIEEEKCNDLMLHLDDEWTSERLIRMKIKSNQLQMKCSIVLAIIAAVVSLLSCFGLLFKGKIVVFLFGAILVGIGGFLIKKNTISILKGELEARKLRWKKWFKKPN